MQAGAPVRAMLFHMGGTILDTMRFRVDAPEVRRQRHSRTLDNLAAVTPPFIGLAERLQPAFSTPSHHRP